MLCQEQDTVELELDPVIYTAEWMDPDSQEFFLSHQIHPLVNYTIEESHSHSRSTSCGCPNFFKPNKFSGLSGLPSNLISALEYAQCLWGCVISLPSNTVQLMVNYEKLKSGHLATAGPKYTTDSKKNLIPCALAGAGKCSSHDIKMNVDPNSQTYYYGLDGKVGSKQFDFVTVALHELGHGLGFFSNAENDGYSISAPYVAEFDKRIRYDSSSGSTYPWAKNPPTSVSTCGTAATSNKLYFNGKTYTSGRLYNPGEVSGHWDESTYPVGNVNSLLTPSLRNGESIHVPGPLTCDVLQSIGYTIPSFDNCGF